MSNTYFIIISDADETYAFILHFINEAHMMIMVWYFNSFAVLGSMLYRSINYRVSHAVDLLRDFDNNVTYWNGHKARKSKVCRDVLHEIQHLCYLHRLTKRTLQEIRELFQLPILLTVVYEFTLVISTIYYTYTSFVQDVRDGVANNYAAYASSLFYMCCMANQFFLRALFFEQVTRRAQRTGVLLNEFIESEIDHEVDQSIEFFTLELLHQNYKIDLFGLFSVDMSLIYQVFLT
ncbi:uncharacterized protein LOC134290132 [Aedes albopictus]|uniref:Gustatory receptor n=1 Tax=Aedes albopictus TaxID=7160 RepID=A0ABM1YY66_AEDAL